MTESINPSAKSEAMKALGERVAVEGVVQYNGMGRPTSVAVSRTRVFRPDSELMSLSAMLDLFPVMSRQESFFSEPAFPTWKLLSLSCNSLQIPR